MLHLFGKVTPICLFRCSRIVDAPNNDKDVYGLRYAEFVDPPEQPTNVVLELEVHPLLSVTVIE